MPDPITQDELDAIRWFYFSGCEAEVIPPGKITLEEPIGYNHWVKRKIDTETRRRHEAAGVHNIHRFVDEKRMTQAKIDRSGPIDGPSVDTVMSKFNLIPEGHDDSDQ